MKHALIRGGCAFVATAVCAALCTIPSASGTPLIATSTPNDPYTTVTADPASTWQTDKPVYALENAGGVVYAGGAFTSVRPPQAPAGTGTVPRASFAAFDAVSGDLLPCAPTFMLGTNPATIRALDLAPDGQTLYVAGRFSKVDGRTALNFAAIDLSSCSVASGVARTRVTGTIWAVTSTATAVYLGGDITAAAGQPRTRLAALAPNGSVLPWAPAADARVYALTTSPDSSRVFAGGAFTTVGGQSSHALVAFDTSTGTVVQVYPGWIESRSVVKALAHDAQWIYLGAEGTGGGVFDGRLAFDPYSATMHWRDNCLGATQAVLPVNDVLYSGSHAHDCSSTPGGFADRTNRGQQHFLVQSIADSTILPWFPDTNEGVGGNGVGPRALTMAAGYLWSGGEFTTVNGAEQQGLTRFGASPDIGTPPRVVPTASSPDIGDVRVQWRTSFDDDDGVLTYLVYRDGQPIPVATTTADSRYWLRPVVSVTDTGLEPGTTHTYRVRVTDGDNLSALSVPVTVTVASTEATYRDRVLGDAPTFYWRLDESAGSTADSATGSGNGTYLSTVGYSQPGALLSDSNSAVTLDGFNDGVTSSPQQWTNPVQYSTEMWFKTTTNSGGKLIGFGNSATGTSSNYDRHVYMTNSGNIVFGVWVGHAETAQTPLTYNDGSWHHLTATQGSSGMRLYVDGLLVASNATTTAQAYNGYWRVGGDNVSGWPLQPSSTHLSGAVDEIAVYPYQLSSQTVADHYAAR